MRRLTLLFHPSLLALVIWLQPVRSECRIVRRGLSTDLLLTGTVLTSNGALHDSAVLVQSGRIAHVGDVCGLGTRGSDASVLDCAGSVISPGFVNTHEHIDFSTVRPFPDLGERTNHRHDWRLGARGYTMREAAVNGSAVDATAWGELRHVFSGTTSIIGKEMVPGLARNLDHADGLEQGLDGPVANYDVFPLDDQGGIQRNGDCDYGPHPIAQDTAARYHRYVGHISEGVDAEAANEFTCLSNATFDTIPADGGGGLSTDIMAPNVALVHALGLTPEDYDVIAARGAKIVWSPRSNVFLYGKTLDVKYLLDAGITVALGTDWLPSGSATMAREAICAAAVTRKSHGVELSAKTLWEMATINGAKVAGFERELGSLETGKLADIVVFAEDAGTTDPFAQAIFAPQEKIELVLRGGEILLAKSALAPLTRGSCETVAFGAEEKTACVADELGSSFAALEASLAGVYPVVLPALPPEEPTCEPTRS
ncbi:metal dependent amidohydrolase [Xylaria intraflava]|nr:metal dependent amidohydrolase [Xylaria intraflava]